MTPERFGLVLLGWFGVGLALIAAGTGFGKLSAFAIGLILCGAATYLLRNTR